MTEIELKAAKMYETGRSLTTVSRQFPELSSSKILHAASVYRRAQRIPPKACRNCEWRKDGLPCVLPKALCPQYQRQKEEIGDVDKD